MEKSSIKKHVRSPAETAALYFAGLILAIYMGFLMGAAYVEGNSFTEFIDNFQEFIIKQHHLIVGVTNATPIFVLVMVMVWTFFYIMHATKIEHPFAGEEYGRARWGNARRFSKEFACHDPAYVVEVNTGDVKLKHPLKVNTANYWIAEDVYISIFNEKTSNLNILVVGPPGSGKSFRLARPILSQLCGNFVVTDPKGELYKQCGQYFEDNGYEVMVLNVESEDSMPMSIHFNPFSYIRNESDIMSIAGILMKATTPPEDNGGNDQFFEQSAEVLLTSIIYLIHYHYPKEEQNWATFVKLLDATCVYTGKDGAIEKRADGILDIAQRAQKVWKEEKHHESDFPGYVAIEKYYNGAAETTSSIVASLDAHCRYMKLECVIDLLSEDEIHIADSFGYSKPSPASSTGKRILFIVTSEDKRYYDWIPSMVYALFFDELYHLTAIDPALKETLPVHLTLLMDEFCNVTLPDSFVGKLSTFRSRNISAALVVQTLVQLKRKFPKFDMDKDLIGNCSIIDILGAPDMDSCEYLAKHFGTQTIHKASDSEAKSYNGTSSRTEDVMQKSLLSAEDIFAMKKDGECAIVVKGADPLYQTKCRMEKTDFVKLLCRKDHPYDPAKRRKERIKALESVKSRLYTGEEGKKVADQYREKGGGIRVSTIEEEWGYYEAVHYKKPENRILTEDDRKRLEENARRYKRKVEMNKSISMDEFRLNPDGNKCDESAFFDRCSIVRILKNDHYTNAQIRALKPFIISGWAYEKISRHFSPETPIEEIEEYIGQAGIVKK
ncbi:MAG: type IV secretory system conjugative DNA transfer family protein [Lachnospiraceae bacterium]|nr:type IV secretory system conjugative DNA transfer family protein [Lachnospiraceae bacterium]